MQIDSVKKILCLGAGTMGQQVALQCAMYGYQAVLYARHQSTLDNAMVRIEGYKNKLIADGLLKADNAAAVMARISATNEPQTAADEVDLVIESVIEDVAVKTAVFEQFSRICPARTVFTTNTSSLLPSMFAQATGRPARFAALHFHTYVWNSTVVDIMPHAGTEQATLDLLKAFAMSIGQIPIVLTRETPNYVVNAMLSALNDAALTLASTGVASVSEIDKAWRGVMKMPMGPFGMMDHIGIDVTWQITDQWAGISNNPQVRKNADFLKGYVDQNALGVKNGKGFYQYAQMKG